MIVRGMVPSRYSINAAAGAALPQKLDLSNVNVVAEPVLP